MMAMTMTTKAKNRKPFGSDLFALEAPVIANSTMCTFD